MDNINQNLDAPLLEESKQNLSKSNSENPSQDTTFKAKKSPRKSKEEFFTTSTGEVFNKTRYQQMKKALGLSGTLQLPRDIDDDGSYEYFWASTQYNGMIEKKKNLGYEVCTGKNQKEYTQFAGMDGNIKHEHVLMRISKDDRRLISEIQREKRAEKEMDQIIGGSDLIENKTRLDRDGELTLSENLKNKYNNNQIKQV